MKPTPPPPSRANATLPMPDDRARLEGIVKSIYDIPAPPPRAGMWTGSRPGAIPTQEDSILDIISASPQETRGRRQGNEEGNRRAGPIRQEGEGWVYAPATSHISRFRLDDTMLTVVFKGPPSTPNGIGVGEVAEYAYYFGSDSEANVIYDRMRRSGHPYGTVLYPSVIQADVPHRPIGLS